MLTRENKSLVLIYLLFLLINSGESANILALMPIASHSHHLWNSVLIHELAERGHNITILSADLPKSSEEIPKNVHYIHLERIYDILSNATDEIVGANTFIGLNVIEEMSMFYRFITFNNKGAAESKGFQQLLNYPENFKVDLIVYDFTFGGLLLGFMHKFNYPALIGLSAFPMPLITVDCVGGHFYPGYIPFYSLSYDTDMNLLQRIYNTILYAADTIYRRTIYTPTMDDLMRKYFPKDTPYLGSLQERMSLALVNSHPSINYPQPLPPNVIEIGGLQIKDSKPLENNLRKFIEKSKNGAVFFSLGTNINPSDIGSNAGYIILKVMEELSEYHFLWKFDRNLIKRSLPPNVMIRDFFPQSDILAHPKIKLFITHAGGLSTQEAIWRAVPMIGIPFFADQHRNIHKSVLMGIAVKIDFSLLTVETLKKTIQEVLTNETYTENIKTVSRQFRDRPMKPLDTAIWWMEYLLRNPEPHHLKSPVIKYGMFVTNGFDIIVLIIIILICFCMIVLIFFYILCCRTHYKKNLIKSDKKHN